VEKYDPIGGRAKKQIQIPAPNGWEQHNEEIIKM
jgi:hypothetical protein